MRSIIKSIAPVLLSVLFSAAVHAAMPEEIVRPIQPTLPIDRRIEPAWPDHHQHRPHLIEPARDHGLEVRPRLDVIDVAKHRARTEALLERVGEPTSEAGAVVAAIGDEHARHGGG